MNPSSLIIKTAIATIRIETKALAGLADKIGADFEECVQQIHQCGGRVLVTGIGKSAIVAQKITATLNSTGTPAIFMHAADAIHGDLGMLQKKDILLCLSKSGETAEIKALLPLVKRLGNLIIAVVANESSYLARNADYLLHTPMQEEADPNNLAPTTSTTLQMVMGDALATSLLAVRGFTPKDFGRFHPGGTLGKRLYLRVEDLYPQNERPVVHVEEGLQQVIMEMTTKRLGMTGVVNDQNQITGIITDGDLRRMLERSTEILQLKARDIMTIDPLTIQADELAVKAMEIMQDRSITQLLVMEDGLYVGVVHLHDLIREGLI